jgi:hypothetical protein
MEVLKIKKNYLFNRVMNIKRLSMSLLLIGMFLFLTGCSSSVNSSGEDQNISAIKTVLEHQFTGPDSEFIEGLDNTEKLEQYYEKRFRPYFTEERYTSFIASQAYDYLLMAYNNGVQIKAEKVTVEGIESTDGVYHFKVVVVYDKEGNNQKSAEVSGKATLNKEGKIASIQYLNDGGLSHELKN